MKQSKLRRKRVFRYSILYFVMLFAFVGLIVGPVVAGNRIPKDELTSVLKGGTFEGLFQPDAQDNNDTDPTKVTGTGRPNYDGVLASQIASKAAPTDAPTTTAVSNKMLLV